MVKLLRSFHKTRRYTVATVFFMLVFPLLFNGCGKKPVDHPLPPVIEPKPAVKKSSDDNTPAARINRWLALMKNKYTVSVREKLELVNLFFNQLEFIDDIYLWGTEDYWATPQEMLINNGGDCEDFAIAKYFTLSRMNVPQEKMRLAYVKSLRQQQPHMVLNYFSATDGDPLVLDNVEREILSASQRPDLIPVYSFNNRGLWIGENPTPKTSPHGLSRWQQLQDRFYQNTVTHLRDELVD
ncbi:transglutaminase-like cysteine peptidase [Desulforhopalus singaporensis]|uniref:Transglutaminase-like cysteine proteinase BTLCP n=1 Tax=Desulforhopalus singaporensis TaxID=91360 RepID=A0A1H0UBC5_9BACT|nr:transglutaminase-like cysteine peptidase [Desulforhopalus singaporensis]SDP63489.1 transglutaminase-like cysteine proteinase BTLCP [Desulforhopalus singaporensis]